MNGWKKNKKNNIFTSLVTISVSNSKPSDRSSSLNAGRSCAIISSLVLMLSACFRYEINNLYEKLRAVRYCTRYCWRFRTIAGRARGRGLFVFVKKRQMIICVFRGCCARAGDVCGDKVVAAGCAAGEPGDLTQRPNRRTRGLI